jgi:hypothetical protein
MTLPGDLGVRFGRPEPSSGGVERFNPLESAPNRNRLPGGNKGAEERASFSSSNDRVHRPAAIPVCDNSNRQATANKKRGRVRGTGWFGLPLLRWTGARRDSEGLTSRPRP